MPKRMSGALLLSVTLLAAALLLTRAALPDTLYTVDGDLTIASMPWVRADDAGPASRADGTAAVGRAQSDTSRNVTLTAFGIPVKTVRVVEQQRRAVQVSGVPFGVKMFSNGALVVAFSDRCTALGTENPAKEAGLRLGDLIISAGGRQVRSNDELSSAISDANGAPIQIVYLRSGREYTCTLQPVADQASGVWRAGLWVRDSSAGIGTLTFTDQTRGTFAGLGHAISDIDTGASIQLLSGEIVPVVITGCIKGAAGSPGELRGEFPAADDLGVVLANDSTGVYGRWQGGDVGQTCPVAQPQEIMPGEAQILATLSGREPRLYTVRIERVNLTAADPNRNLLIRVTDPELLRTAGGIVQGMSGSPVLQNGRLVGALTHVLVNDPTRGYGIFASTMLEKADSVVSG